MEFDGWGCGKNQKGDEEGETVIRIYCMKELFSTKKIEFHTQKKKGAMKRNKQFSKQKV